MALSGVFLLIVTAVALQYGCTPVDATYNIEESLYKAAKAIEQLIATNETIAKIWADHLSVPRSRQKRASPINFRCAVPSTPRTPPSSVHDLRPEDISVIGALGDSLTAGNGIMALTVLGSLTQYRGRSWSIGGDGTLNNGILTLPNVLKKYNPRLTGYSLGTGGRYSRGANLNVADLSNMAYDMPGQARMLVDRIRADSTINMDHDWKLVTLFIGGNNLCTYCNSPEFHSPPRFIAYVQEALDILHENLPRTFVNLVNIFDITPIGQMQTGIACSLVHAVGCPCPKNREYDTMLRTATQEYQRLGFELVNSRRYNTRDDFTVVVMPFFRDSTPPRTSSGAYDMSYFAPDCFHFSEKGHQAAAAALWNNMLQPLASKSTVWDLAKTLRCPEDYGRQTFPTWNN